MDVKKKFHWLSFPVYQSSSDLGNEKDNCRHGGVFRKLRQHSFTYTKWGMVTNIRGEM
jgi:hypothetical protein